MYTCKLWQTKLTTIHLFLYNFSFIGWFFCFLNRYNLFNQRKSTPRRLFQPLCANVCNLDNEQSKKIPSVYWNNRILLMSLKTRFCSSFFQVAKKLINQFLLFQYSCLYISAKNMYSWTFYTLLERAWSAVYCVQVWKLQVFHGPRKSPLNIETIEFC